MTFSQRGRAIASKILECRAMTEREMLERYVTTNDPDAFRGLVERHGPMVLAVCRSVLRTSHDVEDAFQITFLALARHAGEIKQRDTIAPWLHRVASRASRRARRRLFRDRVVETLRPETEPESTFQPRDLSFAPLLHEEVSRLPDGYRLPVMLCYLDGITNEEAAIKLRCPVGTIKGRLSRARQRLRDRLRRRGLDLYAEAVGTAGHG
jgi:RNA polymerase sigma factor (sigma-70 family)